MDRAPVTAARQVFDTVAAACSDAARRPLSAARRSPRGHSRPVLHPEVCCLFLLYDRVCQGHSELPQLRVAMLHASVSDLC